METYIINSSGSSNFTFPTEISTLDKLQFNNTSTGRTGTIIEWEVPASGVYRIKTYGAYGYIQSNTLYGKGAHLEGNFEFEEGDELRILVGQKGDTYGGAGGGTFVTKVVTSGGHVMYDDTRVIPLIISGGGGGAESGETSNIPHASLTESGKDSRDSSGGEDGNGGTMDGNNHWIFGHPGGGFLTDGEAWEAYARHGYSFLNGGNGGTQHHDYPYGGFGGGAAAVSGSSGAGGYSGGAGANHTTPRSGGGGGSYNHGEEAFAELRNETTNNGHGFVEIEVLSIPSTLFIKINNQFKPTKSILRKKEGVWKSPVEAFMKMNGEWRPLSVQFIQEVVAIFSGNGIMPSDIYGWSPLEVPDESNTWSGRNFEGWDPSLPTTIHENTTFTSQWSVTASFNTDGGSSVNDITSSISSNPSLYVEEPETTKIGYILDYWNPSIPRTITENTTFTAQWEEIDIQTTEYLTFQSDDSFILATGNKQKHWDGDLYYSTDTENWSIWNGSEINSSGNKLYITGLDNTYITGTLLSSDSLTHSWVLDGAGDIECWGNIQSLLNYESVENNTNPTMSNNCFSFLFFGNERLIKGPELPATTLANWCYFNMFNGCTSLTQAPELPATTLQDSSYRGMFQNCTSLTQAPELPATTLANSCYFAMFNFCSNIKISATQDPTYQHEWRIPTSGTGTTASASDWNLRMLNRTGGTFTDDPEINTTYYTTEEEE